MSVDESIKQALKEALKEWLDEKFALFGKWTAVGLASSVLVILVWVILIKAGWKPPVPLPILQEPK